MTESGQEQRLAAILAADAVGYSRLMEVDEDLTVRALGAARSIFKAAVETHRGHVINTAGDSVLALFDTAAGAVTAALEVQRELDVISNGVPPDRQLRFRIGIHMGDVMERADGDVHGDGVNIAARLQALAAPGGIVVSEAVRGAVKSRVAAAFDDRGLQQTKNISEPVRAFSVRALGSPSVTAAPSGRWTRRRMRWLSAICAVVVIAIGAAWWLRASNAPRDTSTASSSTPGASVPSGKPSIAVLPFDNMSGEPAQAYFADGITEDLITDLSKVAGLIVIARNSTFQYKGKARDVREIGKALNARYVLEGSVRRSGDSVRVNAQLIDATTGAHVWADRYDGAMKDIFGVQDTVTRNVVKALSVELTGEESKRVAMRGTENASAYDAFLRGWDRYLKQTPADFRAAIVEFKKAAEIDPKYGRAYAALAALYWESYTRSWGEAIGTGFRSDEAAYQAEQYLAKAMRAPTPLADQVASAIAVQSQRHDEAIADARRAIANDPNDANGYIVLANALSFDGKPTEALDAVDRATRLNPHYQSSYLYQRGLAQFVAKRLTEAATSLEGAIAMNPDEHWSQRLLLATYGSLGRRSDAEKLAATMRSQDKRGLMANRDPLSIHALAYWYPFSKPEDAKRFADGLAKAGIPD